MGSHWLKLFLFLLSCIALTVSESYYSIIAPGLIKSNRKYTVVVTLHETESPCLIRVGIKGPGINPIQDVELQPFETKLIDFYPNKLLHGDYKLIAEGLSGVVFKNESILYASTYNGPKIYIQTDKAIYKPKDLVKFRFSILDEHSRPLYINDPIQVEILDDKDIFVKQFKNVTLTKGLYTGQFQLSQYPTQGYWKIKVALGGNYDFMHKKQFKVIDYQLPKFSVFIKAPTDFVLDDGSIQVILYGKYTFNKYVKGNATIKLYNKYGNINDNKPLAKMEIDIETVASVEFNIKDIKNITTLYDIKLLAEITEKNTGKTERDEQLIILRNQRYNIEIPYDQIEFNDNEPFRLKALVKHWTGAPVLDYKTPITMEHGEYPTSKSKISNIPRFRQRFPETWIFHNFYINDTTTELTLPIPDTITTWRITAFSNNDVTGFGIVNGPKDITVIQPLFISLNLPYAVKRGEIVSIPITIFNYLNQTVDVEVVLYNNDEEFYFMESKLSGIEKSYDEQEQTKSLTVEVNKAETTNFLIFPIHVGEISLKISATSVLYSDAISEKLKVEPEGVSKQETQALYITIPTDEKISSSFNVELPEESVPDSEHVTFSVGGHYLVPTIEKFDDLIQMPTGCGEQNVINFAPSVLILQYLEANNKLSKDDGLVKNLISSIEIGYQQQLSFRHDNGGFSVFGEKTDEEASTWLTAYVVRYLIKASKYSDIEKKVIENSLEYLAKQQNSNGEFPYTGYLLKQNHKNPYGLTAFVLLAFLENNNYAIKYKEVILKAVNFLNSNSKNVYNDIYALSIVATVLKRTKSTEANAVIEQLLTYGREEKGLKWWSGNDVNPANDIEITAYSAMSLLETPGDHTPILKWLIEQRNANGGFSSSHDTVVGLEALVKFSEKYKNFKNINLRITYAALDQQRNEIASGILFVDSTNYYVLQEEELPSATRFISFNMEGGGNCLVQAKHEYHITETEKFQHFNIKPKANFNNSEEINLEICFTYQADQLESNDTNMIIMEINLPSGFRSEAESSLDLKQNKLVQKIETKHSESTIILYLNNLKAEAHVNHCLNIPADKTNEVLMPKPAAIIMYDYYNLSRSNTKFYTF